MMISSVTSPEVGWSAMKESAEGGSRFCVSGSTAASSIPKRICMSVSTGFFSRTWKLANNPFAITPRASCVAASAGASMVSG